jgi:hypothetical protein
MTDAEIAALVTEGAKLNAEIAKLEAKNERLDEIKAILRQAAHGCDATFLGTNGETAAVSHLRDGIARSIRGKLLDQVLKLCGDKVWRFFQLTPIAGKDLPQKDLRVQVLTDLPKQKAARLLNVLTVPSMPRVKFS